MYVCVYCVRIFMLFLSKYRKSFDTIFEYIQKSHYFFKRILTHKVGWFGFTMETIIYFLFFHYSHIIEFGELEIVGICFVNIKLCECVYKERNLIHFLNMHIWIIFFKHLFFTIPIKY